MVMAYNDCGIDMCRLCICMQMSMFYVCVFLQVRWDLHVREVTIEYVISNGVDIGIGTPRNMYEGDGVELST